MDCVTPILDYLSNTAGDLFAHLFGHMISLERNISSLKREMSELQNLTEDVKREVDAAERQRRLTRTNQVKWWLGSTDALGGEVAAIDVEFQRLFRCFGDCPLNVVSRYRLSRRASEKLAEVRDLKEGRGALVRVADGWVVGQIEELPITPCVGVDQMLDQLYDHVTGDEVGIVGLCGMGGVGKTNLLKQFNNQLLFREHDFDVVIFLEVTRQPSADRIQRAIGSRLGLRWQEHEDQTERATHIFTVLSKMKFVMLLDDIWEPLHLPSLGIPLPDSRIERKIVLATRMEDVCNNMDAQKVMRVECLPWDEAWGLFVEKIGAELAISLTELHNYVKAIARKCGGLPLALTSVGRAMASKRTREEWVHAFMSMVEKPWDLPGMTSVLQCLKPSYDALPTDKIKECFLYCSLYPEGAPIKKATLIDYWLCEGFLDDDVYVIDTGRKGHDVIGVLEASCLLDDDRDSVKMHSMLRNLALWIASDRGKKKDRWMVQASVLLTAAPNADRWREAERISLMDNMISRWPEAPVCPNLVSLMLHYNIAFKRLPTSFFHFMPSLRVLDLSTTFVEELPSGICLLRELRYLNLWQTKLKSLPVELGDLARLKYLQLGWTPTLKFIPDGVIRRLSSTLEMLGLFNTRVDWKIAESLSGHGLSFEELEGLQNLKSLGISIGNAPALQRICSSDRLASSIARLHVFGCDGMARIMLPSTLGENTRNVNVLKISDSDDLEEVVIGCDDDVEEWSMPDLGVLEICNLLRAKIIWRGASPQQVPRRLRFLWIANCPEIEQLIDGSASTLPVLEELELKDLPKLNGICSDIAVCFPSLQSLSPALFAELVSDILEDCRTRVKSALAEGLGYSRIHSNTAGVRVNPCSTKMALIGSWTRCQTGFRGIRRCYFYHSKYPRLH